MTTFCGVCDEPTADRKHYGSLVACCRGCKGFFRRSVRLARVYTCEFNNNCNIREGYRNCCRACRLRGCLAIGLNPKLVHSDRTCDNEPPRQFNSKDSQTNNLNEIQTITKTNCANAFDIYSRVEKGALVKKNWLTSSPFTGTLGSLRLIPPFDFHFHSITTYYKRVDHLIDEYSDHNFNHMLASTNKHHFNLNVELERVFLLEPRTMCDRSKMLWEPNFWLTTETFKRMWCRVALHYIDWASHIVELEQLQFTEQLKMIIGRAVPCIWMILAHRSWKIKNKKCIVLSGGSYVPLDPDEMIKYNKNSICDCLIEAGQVVWDELLEPGDQIGMTEEEFALLRVIAFLNPVQQLSSRGREIVRSAQARYRSALAELILHHHGGHKNFVEASKRLSALLSLLPPMEQTSQIEDQHLTMATMFNIGGLGGELTYQERIAFTSICTRLKPTNSTHCSVFNSTNLKLRKLLVLHSTYNAGLES
ncbi:Nuclear hormone receptor family member nhr-62 [Aphelenchoides besseyi]|nr:Nuclear hormone receptor family member nhr-62 [Aphelenchoides besseyi]